MFDNKQVPSTNAFESRRKKVFPGWRPQFQAYNRFYAEKKNSLYWSFVMSFEPRLPEARRFIFNTFVYLDVIKMKISNTAWLVMIAPGLLLLQGHFKNLDNYVDNDFPTSEEIVLRPSIPHEFEKLNTSPDWNLQFTDSCTGNWKENWFLDGQMAKVVNSEKGMNFTAGPVNRNDAHHAVLWTKDSFSGDMKIEYNYTRTDTQVVNVNILYIQASGVGTESFDRDISKWNDYRQVPTMSKYYYHMDPLHISYAAFPMVNEDPANDYVRVRKYPAEKGKFGKTEVLPAFFNTGLFLPYETYKITVIKTDANLFFKVEGENIERLFSWDLNKIDPLSSGRIGLRHMYTRSARYSDFKVSVM